MLNGEKVGEVAVRFVHGRIFIFHAECGEKGEIIERIDGLNETQYVKCCICGVLFHMKNREVIARIPIFEPKQVIPV